ncbi:MAG: type II toxin-antitoxin system RelE/ParE family toxin [Planctomycetes bacterium]|nr:type II toxin-antitoxin system RelE/ParE family toxin [Planctomycetota bacterium]
MEQKKFEVIFSSSAQKDIERLEVDKALQLTIDIKTYLETSPFPIGKTRIKRLTNFDPPLYRLRSGDFRIYSRIHPLKVIILAITHKKDSKKFLKKFR